MLLDEWKEKKKRIKVTFVKPGHNKEDSRLGYILELNEIGIMLMSAATKKISSWNVPTFIPWQNIAQIELCVQDEDGWNY